MDSTVMERLVHGLDCNGEACGEACAWTPCAVMERLVHGLHCNGETCAWTPL